MTAPADERARLRAMAEHVGGVMLRLLDDVERLERALAVRAKQIGVACMTHDLTHALACGRCLDAERARAERLEASLREMVDTFGNPYREEWLNNAAFNAAVAVVRRARAALAEPAPAQEVKP